MDVVAAVKLLHEESAELDAVVAALEPSDWACSTPAEGWTIADQIAHLHWTDLVSLQSLSDDPAFRDLIERVERDGSEEVHAARRSLAGMSPDDLLRRWRTGRAELANSLRSVDPSAQLTWFGPAMRPITMGTARIMETWAHGLDIWDALGQDKPADQPLRAVVRIGVRTFAFSFASQGLPAPDVQVRVEVGLPDGTVLEHGPEGAEDRVHGSAWGFAAVVTQRRHIEDVDLHAEGPVARKWMGIAQAFAGEATAGPGPGSAHRRAGGATEGENA